MGVRAGGGASGGMGSKSRSGASARGNFDPDYGDVNIVAKTMMQDLNQSYESLKFNYNQQTNAEAAGMVEDVAKGDYGFASQVAQTVAGRAPKNSLYHSYGISEKQSYVIAKAAVEHGHVPKTSGYSKSFHQKVAQEAARKQAAKQQKWEAYSATYKKSSTKVAAGSRVYDSKHGWGTIGKVITKSTGYVSVKFDSGKTTGAMAFNLKGEDGNPLKKRPK